MPAAVSSHDVREAGVWEIGIFSCAPPILGNARVGLRPTGHAAPLGVGAGAQVFV